MGGPYLVTGGAGFIGSHVAGALAARGDRVRVLDDLATGKRENLDGVLPGVELRRGDVRDPSVVRAALRGVDIVVHLAGLRSVPRSCDHPDQVREVNVAGTRNVLACARQGGVRRVVAASSVLVYGDGEHPQREEQPLRPASAYGQGKVEAERECARLAAEGLEVVVLRYFNVYGPRQDGATRYAAVIPEFITRLAAGQPCLIFGDGRQTRDFIYISDAVRATLAACLADVPSGTAINVGSGKEVSILDLAAALRRLLGSEQGPVFQPSRSGDICRSLADTRRCENLLRVRPEVELQAGLERTAAWMLGR